MEAVETLYEFYARTQADAINIPLNNAGAGHFNVFSRENCNGTPYGRRDFYKVTLIIGKGRLRYADRWLDVDRPALLKAFRAYLQANDLEADWESVSRAENAMLVNALSMMAPYGPAEKQALLEAADLKTRAETLIAITEMALARENEDFGSSLQ